MLVESIDFGSWLIMLNAKLNAAYWAVLACLLVQHLKWADVHLSHETLGQNKRIVWLFLLPSCSKLWRQDGCHWDPSCLLGSGCVGEQRALSRNLHRVTTVGSQENKLYLQIFTLSFLLASSKHQHKPDWETQNIQQHVCRFTSSQHQRDSSEQ